MLDMTNRSTPPQDPEHLHFDATVGMNVKSILLPMFHTVDMEEYKIKQLRVYPQGPTGLYDNNVGSAMTSGGSPSMTVAPPAGDDVHVDSSQAEKPTSHFGSTTNAADQTASIVSKPSRYRFLDPKRSRANFDGVHADIKSYLAKPVILYQGNFSSTDGPSTFPVFDIMSGLSNTMMYDKIKTIYAISAKTIITVKFNGNPFQQGRMLLAHLPTGGMLQSGTQFNDYVKIHRYSKQQITQLPHVQFDLNSDTSAELHIPYQSTYAAMPVYPGFGNTVVGSPGVAFMYPYEPMVATSGSVSIPYTMWVHYEDVELHSNIIPQMGNIRRGTAKSKDLLSAEMRKPGPVETAATFVADVSTALLGVPILSSIAGPVSWISEALARSAKVFGWSKPLLISEPVRSFRQFAPYLSNYDTKSNAEQLGLSVENHVSILPGFAGNDMDELSIDFLKGISCYWQDIGWSNVSPPGLLLLNQEIHPSMFRQVIADGGGNIETMSPLGFLDYQFAYWRGGIKLKFIFVKTAFHSGRLSFTFVPNYANIAPAASTLSNTAYVHREIVDIRVTNEFDMTIPYISPTDWLPCSSMGRLDRSMGYLQIHIIDPLVSPATVSPSINIILEGCGAPDLQFSVPMPCAIQPVIPLTLQMGDISTDLGTVGGTGGGEEFFEAYEDTIGEVHLSLRPLLKRGAFTNFTNLAFAGTTLINPHVLHWRRSQAVGAPLGTEEYDPFNVLSSFYHSSRGGMRVGLYSNFIATAVDATVRIINFVLPSTWTTTGITFTPGYTASQVQWRTNSNGSALTLRSLGGTMVQIPQYLPRPTRVVGNQVASNTYALTYTTGTVTDPNVLLVRVDAAASTTYNVYRAVADDFSLGGFVSIPPMYIVPSP